MSKTLIEARLPSLKDKIDGIAPTDTADAVIVKLKKESIKKTKVGKIGAISKKKK
mgnify:FL=1